MNDIRYYIDLIEGIVGKKNYVGKCNDVYDEDGQTCIVPELPFKTVMDQGIADDDSEEITKEEFFAMVNVPGWLIQLMQETTDNIDYLYYEPWDLYMLYFIPSNGEDAGHDIHYFFV